MKAKILLIGLFFLVFQLHAQNTHKYDFNSIAVGSALNNTDNWKSTFETVSGGDFEINYAVSGSAVSPDASLCLLYNHGGPGVGQTASRKTTPAFPFDFSAGGIVEIEVKLLINWWGVGFGWGYDATDNGTMNFGPADANDGGCWFYLKNSENVNHNKHYFKKPDGTSVNFTYDNSLSEWNVFRFSVDLTANSGAGALTMSGKTPSGTWQTIPEINNLNLGLTPNSGDKKDPAKWKTIFLHSQGAVGGFDDIIISQYDANFQYITFESIPTVKLTTDPTFKLKAYTNHSLPVTFSVSGPATIIDGDSLHIDGVGEVVVIAHQIGNGTISPAQDVSQSFLVVDPATIYPIVDVKNPVVDAKIKNPNLVKIPISVSAKIDYPNLLDIAEVKLVVGSDEFVMKSLNNDYFIYYWAPPAYALYTGHIVAKSSTGSVTTSPDFNFEVVKDSSAMEFTAIDHLHMEPFTNHGVLKKLDTTVVFPSVCGTYSKVTAYLYYDCPVEGCDPWDRTCRINSRGSNGEYIELLRYITPYAKACSDSVDITDIISQLQGKVDLHIEFPAKSLITLILKYHKGASDGKYSWVEKVWYNPYYAFGSFGNLQSVESKSVVLSDLNSDKISAAYLRILSSGHNWGENNTGNAAEFKDATHNIKVNGSTVFTQRLWQTCNPNPTGCNGQAGTWMHSRAGWCPGSMPMLWRFNLSNYLNQNLELVYEFDPSYTDLCSSNNPNCVSGTTCADCNDPANPIIDVSANLITYYEGVTPNSIEDNNQTYQLYPNPSNGVYLVSSSNEIKNAIVSVFDIKGNQIKTFKSSGNSFRLDISENSKGIYILKICSDAGVAIKKIIIE